MDDLTMTKLCAEAMGLEVAEQLGGMRFLNTQYESSLYDPLASDAQAMALVKKFRMGIDDAGKHGDMCGASLMVGPVVYTEVANDLNRAIVECVANMQKSKEQAR